ncbi:hypothetical protein MHU86_3223 [Fragilaria crotonensis]|nr:hypothetical protein MHU86_3223 [Fragilaria crotonensis]
MSSTAPVSTFNVNNTMTNEEKKEEDEDDNGSSVMDLANFLSSELIMTRQNTVPHQGDREPEYERTYPQRRQSRIQIDSILAGSRRNSMEPRNSLAESTSSIETVKMSNKEQIVWDDLLSVDSGNKEGCFSMKSLEDLTLMLAIPPREDLTPMHRRSQGNKAA